MSKINSGNELGKIKIRYNVLTTMVYIVGIVLLCSLFNLQIIHGEEYREKSNTRLTRESTLQAARGDITDSSGNKLATTKIGFSLEMYKTKIDTKTLNNTLLNITKILDANGDTYNDSLPIAINPIRFTYEDEEKQKTFKTENKIDENATAEETFYKLKEKYEIENSDETEVRKIMGLRYEIALQGYSSTKTVKLADNISSLSVNQLNEQGDKFPGITISQEPIRDYIRGSLASHILGYINRISSEEYNANKDIYDSSDIIGRAGVESVFEDYLRGKKGTKQIDMAVDGTITGEYIEEEAVAGSTVVLTIDANLQKVAEDSLKSNIEKIVNGGFGKKEDARAGAVVVMNVHTGELLALASYPDFDPNAFVGGISNEQWQVYRDETLKPMLNRAIQEHYSPGSIFKMVTATAALETGTTTTTERINDTGVYPRWGNPKCWYYSDYGSGHGWLNVSGAIKHSCNYFFYEMGYRMGIDTISEYAKAYGLGSKTGIELPSETAGILAQKKEGVTWNPGNTLSAAIGQMDNSFSVLQMTKYISMLANGGKNIDVTLLKTIIDAEGNEIPRDEIEKTVNEKLGIKEEDSTSKDINIKEENLAAILEGMKSVTTETGGTAYSIFKNFDIEVGGKTGSAEAGKNTNAWFAGFAPFDDPEIAVVVFVENGVHGYYTAEVVRDIVAEYFGMNSNEVEESQQALPTTEIQN